jgi:hypothetical protein
MREARVRRPQLEQFHRQAMAGRREVQAIESRWEQAHWNRPDEHVSEQLQTHLFRPFRERANPRIARFRYQLQQFDLHVAVGE